MKKRQAHNRCDLTNKRFEKLVACSMTGEVRDRSCVWLCRCDCGNQVEATAWNLNRGAVKSCGCLRHRPPAESHSIKQNLHFVAGTCIEVLAASQRRAITSQTGIRGVYNDPRSHGYVAYIGFQGKNHYLGHFDTLEEAADARRTAEQRLFTPILSAYQNTVIKMRNTEEIAFSSQEEFVG